MCKFSIDQIENVLDMIDLECPSESFPELYEFQSVCENFENCFDCWLRTVRLYVNEQFLESPYDESEDK